MPDNKTVTFDASAQRVVPLNPTDEMLTAGWDALGWSESGENDGRHPRDVFHAMLAAAPTPAAQSADSFDAFWNDYSTAHAISREAALEVWQVARSAGQEAVAWTNAKELAELPTLAEGYARAMWGSRIEPFSTVPLYTAPVNASEPIGVAEPMPGSDGLTMATFEAAKVPVGTVLYTAPVNGGNQPGSVPPPCDRSDYVAPVNGGERETAADQNAHGWLQEGSLLYRLTDDSNPRNRDEIHVTMVDGSRTEANRAARATQILALIRRDERAADANVNGGGSEPDSFAALGAQVFGKRAADAQQVGGDVERIKAIPTVVWWHPDGYIVHNNLNGDDLIRRSDALAALTSPAKVGGQPVEGLGRMTAEGDGMVTLKFVDEGAAQSFMCDFKPSVEVDAMPEPPAKVGGDELETLTDEQIESEARLYSLDLANGLDWCFDDFNLKAFVRSLLNRGS